MIAVVATPGTARGIDDRLLPATCRIAYGAGRTYRFYTTNGKPMRAAVLPDLDGSPLVETHYFATVAEADAWVAADVRRRAEGQ